MRPFATALIALLLLACGSDDALSDDTSTSAPVRDSIAIPSLGVDAPLEAKQFQVGVPLPSPDSQDEVVLYDFSSAPELGGLPGEGGNVIMTGRSVSDVCTRGQPPCNGVFVRLRFIALGDRIDVNWQERSHRYQVVAVCGVPVAQFTNGVYRRTPEEQLTLITDIRGGAGEDSIIVLVIVARPAPVTAGESCPVGTLPVVVS